jgi:hypothetical protein
MVAPLFLLAAALATVWMLEPVFALEQPLLNFISIALLFAFLIWMLGQLFGRTNRSNQGGS